MSMNELVKIGSTVINNEQVQTVNARELHAFLEVGRDFSNWIKSRIEQYNFVENQDFIVYANSGVNPVGGRPAVEYHITIDMAKELGMVERSEKGKEIRQYFIRCEKEAKQPLKVLSYREMALAVLALEDERERLQVELDQSKHWVSIKKVALHNGVKWQSLSWRDLKAVSIAIGFPPKKIFDANFPEGVNVYHKEAWQAVYPSLNLPNGER